MPTIAEIAAATIAAVTPLLPYIETAGTIASKSFTEALAKSGGSAAWKGAERIWSRLLRASEEDPKLDAAIKLLSADTNDTSSILMLQKTLEELLARNPGIREDLLSALGGETRVQKLSATSGSRISGTQQEMRGRGQQKMSASDESVIENSRQSIED